MTPYELGIILNAQSSTSEPYDHCNAPIYAETMGRLCSAGLFSSSEFGYLPTLKLHNFVRKLCDLAPDE